MNSSIVQTFGPFVQLVFAFGLLLLAGICIGSVSLGVERKLYRVGFKGIWLLPIIASIVSIFYGTLRFWGVLIYSADGWDSTGPWNYTNQNEGACVIYICGCLLVGMILAIYKEKKLIDAA